MQLCSKYRLASEEFPCQVDDGCLFFFFPCMQNKDPPALNGHMEGLSLQGMTVHGAPGIQGAAQNAENPAESTQKPRRVRDCITVTVTRSFLLDPLCVCVCVCVHACMSLCAYICICMYVSLCVCVCVHACHCVRTYACVCVCVCVVYICVCVCCIYMCVCVPVSVPACAWECFD